MNILYVFFFWAPFGTSCLVTGRFIDKIKSKEKLCLSFIIWGILVVLLNFTTTNIPLALLLIVLIGINTALNVIIGAIYMSSNIKYTEEDSLEEFTWE
ncbi:MAG: hypothetical protein ACTSR8_19810 [Promethearchaeota archaeon]